SFSHYDPPLRPLNTVRARRSAPLRVARAALTDMKHTLGARLAWSAPLAAAAIGLLLFLAVPSVLVPVKAVVMSVLSLAVTFGTVVLLFQDGLLTRALGGTAMGYLDPLMPVLVFCIAFGLSMDYEIFLVTRIHEEYLRTDDNDHAIAAGLRHTGRLVTAAAFILVAVMTTLAVSGLVVTQLVGVSLAMAVAVDATVIRCLLVPSVMSLAGRWNWWSPMRRGNRRIVAADTSSGRLDE
ncbi:MMPL family transporter, partial [Streptomyces sp. NPDC001719]